MMSKGSCDSDHWSNDAENQLWITGINYILKCIKIGDVKCYNVTVFYSIFDQINAALVSTALKNIKKVLQTPNF